jgi:ElaB/YqjD/DUF883 family membrane-anchored ribosome-binding protein
MDKMTMTASNEELLEEIKRLRLELQQIRDVVNTLLSMVVEEPEDEIEELDFRFNQDFTMYT